MSRLALPIPALHPATPGVPEWAGKLAFLLLAGYVLVLPTAGTVALRNVLFFSLLVLTLVAAARWRLGMRLPFAVPWLIYLAVALGSLWRAIDPAYSLGEIKAEILYGILATMVAATWVRRTDDFEKLIVAFVSGSAVMAMVACGQAWHDAVHAIPYDPSRLGSLHSGVGDYSTYIVAVMPFLLGLLWVHRGDRRTVALLTFLVALNVAGALITRNRAVFPALALECLVMIFLLVRSAPGSVRWRRAGLWSGAFVLLVLSLFAVQLAERMAENPGQGTLTLDPRWEIWETALGNIQASPWLGAGFGRRAFALLNPAMAEQQGLHWHAHNVFLDKGVQLGLPGMAAFLLLLLSAARAVRIGSSGSQGGPKAATYSACAIALLAGIVCKNMTDDFFVRDQGYLFWILMGASASALRLGPTSESRRDTT